MAFDAPRFIIDIVDVYIAALVVIIIGVVEQTDTSNCCTVYSTLAQVRKKRSSIRFHVFWRMESMYNSSLVNTAAYRCGGAFTSAVADANTQTHTHNACNVFIKTHIYSWWLRINSSWDFRLHDCTGTHTHERTYVEYIHTQVTWVCVRTRCTSIHPMYTFVFMSGRSMKHAIQKSCIAGKCIYRCSPTNYKAS